MLPDDRRPVFYAPAALNDLHELTAFLTDQRGDAAAVELLLKLRAKCESLGEMPLRFPIAEGIGLEIRRTTWESWLIYYRAGKKIEIVRILHQSRDIAASMILS